MGGHVGDVFDVWLNKVVQRVQVGGRGGPVREGYKVVALLLKPSLGLFGLVGRRRVLLPHPWSATGHLIAPGDHHTLQHIQVHFGVDFQADLENMRWHDVALTWNHTKDHNCSRKLCFHHPGHVPVICGYPAMVLAVITWIGREHELYSGASSNSLIEHCVTFRHDRRLLSLLGFVYSWPTSRWSATKHENWFSLNGNGIMSSFLGWQFYRSTLYIYIEREREREKEYRFYLLISFGSIRIQIIFYKCACGIIVTLIRDGLGYQCSNSSWSSLHFT